MPLTPKGAEKFVTFALDSKTDIRRIDNGSKQTRLGKAVRGLLTVSVKSNWVIDYEITPPVEEDRDIVIDEARYDGWKPVGEVKELEKYQPGCASRWLRPRARPPRSRSHASTARNNMSRLAPLGQIACWGPSAALKPCRPALKEAVAKQLSALTTSTRQPPGAKAGSGGHQNHQGSGRLRENLKSVGQGSDLGRRYLDKLKGQEDRLAAIASEDESLEKLIAAKQKDAQDLAQNLSL